jgi:hypothetical protein
MRPPAPTLLVWPLVLVFAALASLHVYWALGGHTGGTAAVPTRPGGAALFTPSPGGTLAVAAALAAAAWIVAVSGGVAPPVGPRPLYVVGAWGLALVLLGRAVGDFHHVGLFKRVRGTPFAAMDDRLYTPLCLALALGVAWLAMHQRWGGDA